MQTVACSSSFSAQARENGLPSAATFWLIGYVYACLAALVMQKLLLPLVPDLHAGNGLLQNDAVHFHKLAVVAADQIRALGWSEWRLFPGAAGNVGLLSAVYAVFGPDPAWFIPINAAAHVTAALFLYKIGNLLWPGRVGLIGGLFAACLFVLFPSALQWYGQNHKDAFAIAGILVMLHAWLKLHGEATGQTLGAMARQIAQLFLGAVLLAIVRPYFPIVIATGFACALLLLFLHSLLAHRMQRDHRALTASVVGIVMLVMVALLFQHLKASAGLSTPCVFGEGVQCDEMSIPPLDDWEWTPSTLLPERIDSKLAQVSQLRAHFVQFGKSVGAGSSIDGSRTPRNAGEVVAYLPRAMFVGLFAPFPSSWTQKTSLPRIVGAIETSIWYLMAVGWIFLLIQNSSRALIGGLVFALAIITVLSYLHPNVGTLYRQRFGLWTYLMACGAVGWAGLLLPWVKHITSLPEFSPVSISEGDVHLATPSQHRGRDVGSLAGQGSVVLLVTLACYMGLMVRDLLLVKYYGLNLRLDVFFSAVMIAMFFVTAFAMPLADAVTRPFLEAHEKGNREGALAILSGTLRLAMYALGTCSFLVYVFAEPLVSMVLHIDKDSGMGLAVELLRLFSPLVFLSAWTIIGNAALNGLGKSKEAAIAQISVPILAIAAILIAPVDWGLQAVASAMVAGTLINVIVLWWCLRRLDISLAPSHEQPSALYVVMGSYGWLVLAALCTAALTPVNFMFAGTLGEGAVSAWAMANKIATLFNGIATIGVTAVVLPYLAHIVTTHSHGRIKNDVHFILQCGTLLGGVLALIVFEFSPPLVNAILGGGDVSESQLSGLVAVVGICALLLPINIVSAVIIKMTVVTGASAKAVKSTAVSLLINVGLNLVLVPAMGVTGIALSLLLATFFGALYLLYSIRKEAAFSGGEALTIAVIWLAWGAACLALNSGNVGMMTGASSMLALLYIRQWRIWSALENP